MGVRLSRLDRLLAVLAASLVAYMLLEAALGGLWYGHAAAVFGAFLVVPALLLPLLMRSALAPGRPDVGLVMGVLAYAPFAVWTIGYVPSNAGTFRSYACLDAGAATLVARIVWVALNVAAVDFFCRRVVQRECASIWGAWAGFAVAYAAWMVGHVDELGWLPGIMGWPAALAYVVAAGAVTGLVYMRWDNVAGLMLGHAALNWAVIAATAALT
jgi:membrane protease YdiL (CAAX protease family)